MKIFVAGGTGALGRASLRALVGAGHMVRSSARGKEKADLVRSLGAEPVDVDLFEMKSVQQALKGMDAVLRLTTKIGPLSKMRDPRMWAETMRLRTEGARVIVDAAIAEGVPSYVHESVTLVYADGGANWISEDAPTDDGRTEILQAALEGERETQRFMHAGGRGVVLRFGGFYGSDVPSTRETVDFARRRLMPQFGAGSNYFTSIYVPDAGRAVLASLDVPAGIYNVCDDEPVTFASYLNALTKAIGAPKLLHLPGFLGKWAFGDVWKYISRSLRVSNHRLKNASRWEPAVRSVTDGWPIVAAELSGKTQRFESEVRPSRPRMSVQRH